MVLHADDWLVAVDKPAGVLSVPGRGQAPALLGLLTRLRLVDQPEQLRIVHRLDSGASGVMILARTLAAQRRLTEIWEQRSVEKVYLAIVRGRVAGDGEIDLPLHVDRDAGRACVDARHGKPSVTRYRVAEHLAGHTLLECVALTGRLHQIRVHLSAIGHPLAVDPLYGGGEALMLSAFKIDYRPNRRGGERPLIGRLTLHALRVAFEHPAGTGPVSYHAEPPKDFRATVNQLRRLLPAAE